MFKQIGFTQTMLVINRLKLPKDMLIEIKDYVYYQTDIIAVRRTKNIIMRMINDMSQVYKLREYYSYNNTIWLFRIDSIFEPYAKQFQCHFCLKCGEYTYFGCNWCVYGSDYSECLKCHLIYNEYTYYRNNCLYRFDKVRCRC